MAEPSDQLLIQQVQAKNRQVFEKIYVEFYPRLVAFAEGYVYSREDGKGIVQNLFVHLWLHPDQLSTPTSLKSYLFTAVKNRCLNHIRDLNISDRHKLQYIEAQLYSQHATNISQEPALEDELLKQIQELPDQMKEILILKYFKNKRRTEIANLLGISENTVKTQLKRGKKKLLKQLKEKKLVVLLPLFYQIMG
ncbi:MAG: RNA polymerase sigma-70 factor [Marinoscillum sp.]